MPKNHQNCGTLLILNLTLNRISILQLVAHQGLKRKQPSVRNIRKLHLILVTHIILFFSSRLKMRISAMSVRRKRLRTALPDEPVPPVIISVLPAKILILYKCILLFYSLTTLSKKVSGFSGLKISLQYITVMSSSVSLKLIIL